MIAQRNGTVDDKYAKHEAKVLGVIQARLREAFRSKITGKLIFDIALHKGGPSQVFTEVGVHYRILEET